MGESWELDLEHHVIPGLIIVIIILVGMLFVSIDCSDCPSFHSEYFKCYNDKGEIIHEGYSSANSVFGCNSNELPKQRIYCTFECVPREGKKK